MSSIWNALNQSVSGRLFEGTPFAEPCFPQFHNATLCLQVQTTYLDEISRSNAPGAYMQTQWETCQATGEQCLLDFLVPNSTEPTLPPNLCRTGSIPSYFIDVETAQDISTAFKFSKTNAVPLVIKNTGHDYKGRSSAPGSLALWTHNLKNMSYNASFTPEGCSRSVSGVTLGAGVQWGEAYDFAEVNNITLVGGSDKSVGATGGWLQGGGHSALSNTMGLGVDRVLEFKVVTPDGQLRTVNDCQNQDLFFALRGGGGGTFGVVLEATMEASPVVKLQTVIVAFTELNATLTQEMWSILTNNGLTWADEGWGGFATSQTVILINPILAPDAAAASAEPLVEFGMRLKNSGVAGASLLVTEFPSWGTFFQAFVSQNVAVVGSGLALASRLISKSNFGTQSNRTALVSGLLAANAATPGLIILISAPSSFSSPGGTSVTEAWRSSLYHVTVISEWNWNATTSDKIDHYNLASSSIDNLRRITPDAAYLNEADVHEPNHEEAFWGNHHQRLLQIKEKYDPEHLLDCWHCVFKRRTLFMVTFGRLWPIVHFASTFVAGLPLKTGHVETIPRAFDVPIVVSRHSGQFTKRGNISGSVRLGNSADVSYAIPIKLGNTVAAVNLDTGSSDLWIMSSACRMNVCENSVVNNSSSLVFAGKDIVLAYGDSKSGTFAKGAIGRDSAAIAGLSMTNQTFGLINSTSNPILNYGISGIFGLGFPTESQIQSRLVDSDLTTDDFVTSTSKNGPLLARMAITGSLERSIFSVDVCGGGAGVLSIGKLADGVDNSSLTWVPVRLYRESDGGMPPPSFAPNEIYPYRWEIDLEAVFLDNVRLPESTILSQSGINTSSTSALIDTGNSILRGPQDVVNLILNSVSPSYDASNLNSVPLLPCAIRRTLSFQIGGKIFPVDPRDFINQYSTDDASTCIADNIVGTDPPSFGSLFSWSLGVPFFRSNLVVFYYGNLTHPSVDPPRIGIRSNIPASAIQASTAGVTQAPGPVSSQSNSVVVPSFGLEWLFSSFFF